jgi:hypothetical protein
MFIPKLCALLFDLFNVKMNSIKEHPQKREISGQLVQLIIVKTPPF